MPYRLGGKRSDNPYVNFYWDFCSRGKPAYIPIKYLSLERAIRLIKNAGGKAILAHPFINIGYDQNILHGIIDCGIDGIEVFSSYHDDKAEAFYHEQTEQFHLLKTMGSDFHGKTKPAIQLGSMHCQQEADIYNSFLAK